LQEIDKDLTQLLDRLEKKLQEDKLKSEKETQESLDPDLEFIELSKNIILPGMVEFKNFLKAKERSTLIGCTIEKPHLVLHDISFELKDLSSVSKFGSAPKITFFPKNGRVHIFEEGTLGDGHPVESSYNKNEITKEFVKKRLTALTKEYVDKLLNHFNS
jgi:hypothetical protein